MQLLDWGVYSFKYRRFTISGFKDIKINKSSRLVFSYFLDSESAGVSMTQGTDLKDQKLTMALRS